jgi:phenylalanyl-tRNA synthetase alpha chain
LEQLVLTSLAKDGSIADTWDFAISVNVDHQLLIGVIKSLMVDSYVKDEPLSKSFWSLTEEGKEVSVKGSPEVQVFEAVPDAGIAVGELNKLLGETAKIGMGVCMKNKWLQKKGDIIVRSVVQVVDETRTILQEVAEGNCSASEEELKNLKKRKLVQQITRKSYKISKGAEFRGKRVKKMADLHKSMLGSKDEVSIFSFCWSSIFFISLLV